MPEILREVELEEVNIADATKKRFFFKDDEHVSCGDTCMIQFLITDEGKIVCADPSVPLKGEFTPPKLPDILDLSRWRVCTNHKNLANPISETPVRK
jgi:hypothetical protein